ncbi:MAG: prepilin-type N-terminal cleavage/methylation domain-containing protein [Elusimicrobiota bacterium]
MTKSKGFTLIELMIVVAIIGILSAIAIPKFADLIRKSNEGATKGNLGALRSSVSIYYGEMEGWFPIPTAAGVDMMGGLLTMENGKYLKEVPNAYMPPFHGKTVVFTLANSTADTGAWGYCNNRVSALRQWGDLWVDCSHTDSKSSAWGAF